ncbi:peptide ABC transporter substrate-binding protein [Anaerophilus nitritogenes]|uniref:peptide ABC transporter substrate-binding protein n=1 Tax=Anaerophilus nitritogenes TaxID=2498136 RepID=UPI00101CDAB5|nr:peptide ABC transporter substrate-binding protein [Anaerophilus nitritogenes]
MKYIKIFFCCFLLICIVMLSACAKKSDDQPFGEEEIIKSSEPVAGGQLRIPAIGFSTLNPIINDNESIYHLSNLIYEGLVTLDQNGRPQPALAKNWYVSDGTTLIFELRDDVVWHDGEAFSAEDVKFTIDTLKLAGGLSIYKVYTNHIQNVQILDNYRVSINFDDPTYAAIEDFIFPIIPKHQFKDSKNVYEFKNITPIGTGSYKIQKYNEYKDIELVINDYYWGKKPYISSVLVKKLPDNEAALTTVEVNKVDVASAMDFDWEKYSENKDLKIYEYVTQEYEFLGFNFRNTLLSDAKMRKVFAYTIDRHNLIDEVYLGHATLVDVPISPSSYLYQEEQKRYGKDLVKAKKLLKELGWIKKDNDPYLENESGQKIKISLLVNEENAQRVKSAESIASDLKEVGIEVSIHMVNFKEYERRIYTGQFDLLLGGWKLIENEDLSFLFHSKYIKSTNFIQYANPNMDQILNEMTGIQDEALRRKKYEKFQKLFIEEIPYLSLYFKNSSIIVRGGVKGDILPTNSNIYNNIENWYIPQNK